MKLKFVALMGVYLFLLTFAAAAEDVTATLEIDYQGDGEIDETVEQAMPEGSTALDLLNKTVDVTTKSTDWGPFVIGINGWMTNWDTEGTWWAFEINGEQAQTGPGSYLLQDGDVLTFSLDGAEEGAIPWLWIWTTMATER